MRRVRVYREWDTRIYQEGYKWRVALTENGVIKFLSRCHYCDLRNACNVKRVSREWHRGIVRNTNFSPYLPLEPSLFSIPAEKDRIAARRLEENSTIAPPVVKEI